MANKPTFIQKKIETLPLQIHLVIPPEKPVMRGYITVDAVVRNRAALKDLNEQALGDEDYLRAIVTGIHGLSDPKKPDEALEGESAFLEVLNGDNSAYLLNAIAEGYGTQYGEARQKNFRTSRSR